MQPGLITSAVYGRSLQYPNQNIHNSLKVKKTKDIKPNVNVLLKQLLCRGWKKPIYLTEKPLIKVTLISS